MPSNEQGLDLQMRLRNLPTDRLEAVANGSMTIDQAEESLKVSRSDIDAHSETMKGMTNEQLEQIASGKMPTPTFGQKALGVIQKVGETVDKYTTGPVRAGAYDFIDSGGSLGAAAKGFVEQFGKEGAPTGQDVAIRGGTPVEVDKTGKPMLGPSSQSFQHGVFLDFALDPTNIIPGGALVKGGGRLLGQGTKLGLQTAGRGTEVAARAAHLGPVIDIAKSTGDATKLAFSKVFDPTVAEDFKQLAEIAQKNNIPLNLLPESVEFGKPSLISRLSRANAAEALGEKALKNFENGLQKTREATENAIATIANGPVLDKVEAGALIRTKYDEAVDKFFDGIDISYNKVADEMPGLRLSDDAIKGLESSLRGVEKFAKGRALRGVNDVQRSQGLGLLNAVDAIRESNGSFKQASESLRMIGDAAFKETNYLAAIPADIEKMRKLYGDLRNALLSSIRTNIVGGEQIASDLEKANAAMSEFFRTTEVVKKTIGNRNLAPEGVFRTLIENGDTQKIEALAKILDPESFQQLKGAFLNSLIKRGDDGVWTFQQLRNSMKNKRTLIEKMMTPDEIKQVGDIVHLGHRFGDAVLSSSETAPALGFFKGIFNGIKAGIANEAFIAALKKRARNKLPPTHEIDSAALKLPGPPTPTPSLLPNALQPLLLLPRRGPVETLLKGAQTYSVQNQNRAKP